MLSQRSGPRLGLSEGLSEGRVPAESDQESIVLECLIFQIRPRPVLGSSPRLFLGYQNQCQVRSA